MDPPYALAIVGTIVNSEVADDTNPRRFDNEDEVADRRLLLRRTCSTCLMSMERVSEIIDNRTLSEQWGVNDEE